MTPRNQNQPKCLVVGCGKECCKSRFLDFINTNPHKLHSGNSFYMIDVNKDLQPDEVVNFFDLSTERKFQAIFTEYCSSFKANPYDLAAFISKCKVLLEEDGVLIIRGAIPDKHEREEFAKKGLNFIYDNNDNWAIYYKNDQKKFDLGKYSPEVQRLLQESGYRAKLETKPSPQNLK